LITDVFLGGWGGYECHFPFRFTQGLATRLPLLRRVCMCADLTR